MTNSAYDPKLIHPLFPRFCPSESTEKKKELCQRINHCQFGYRTNRDVAAAQVMM